jgi:glutamate dehydrogenase
MNRIAADSRFKGQVELLLGQLPGASSFAPAVPRAFVRQVLRGLELRAFAQQKPADVAELLLDLLSFMDRRPAGELAVELQTGATLGGARGSILRCNLVDQPFLFDTIRLVADAYRPAGDALIAHPVVAVHRSMDGHIARVGTPGDPPESVVLAWLRPMSEDEGQALAEEVRRRLAICQVVVRDYQPTLENIEQVREDLPYVAAALSASRSEARTSVNFLRWLVDDHFVIMGLCCYDVDNGDGRPRPTPRDQPRLGMLADDAPSCSLIEDCPRAVLELLDDTKLVLVRKSELESPIHRTGKVDLVAVRAQEGEGQDRVLLIAGLFTRKAVQTDAEGIPFLREKVTRVFEAEGALTNSALARSMRKAINAIPVEYLFEAEVEAIADAMRMIVEAEESREVGSHGVIDESGKSAFALVTIPAERYDDGLRESILDLLVRGYGATYSDHRLDMGDGRNVVLQAYLTAPGGLRAVDEAQQNQALRTLTLDWSEQLTELLGELHPPELASELAAAYAHAFPEELQLAMEPAEALIDIDGVEALLTTGSLQIRFTPSDEGPESEVTHFKLYTRSALHLSDSVPVLDNFGLEVMDQSSATLQPRERSAVHVSAFRVVARTGGVEVASHSNELTQALRTVFSGRAPNDRLNRLLLSAGVSWREVALMRAYVNFGRQLGWFGDRNKVYTALLAHQRAAALLLKLFRQSQQPGGDETQRAADMDTTAALFLRYLTTVDTTADDRVLRRIFELIQATLRTSFFACSGDDEPIALKFDCSCIEELPVPRPYREIYVHHPRFEGVHLRGGPVARGGLRWSERPNDFRTEVLHLMRTQMVKNVLIVPVGAKGGFALNRGFATAEEARAEADAVYQIFIRGLLSVTDNVVAGQVVHPAGMRVLDGEDPYLVVAADKGTAHQADAANAIAQEQGYWLDDAFASGGSQGYDPKGIGITARGAWVCAQRHFYELGIDPVTEPVTVVGIGDMSGDVFGNGMLLSRSLRLQAAFDHRHIFVDPDPDPEASWQERKRLFDLPHSSWNDYDRAVLSEGGGVFERKSREIPLSPQLRRMLNTELDHASGESLIQLILKKEVDLLWNGGIGTYVKASWEGHAAASDPENDSVRINADKLRARVVAEGGNLGLTQAARVEAAGRGVRLNTDAIDNSGGVDMSDHEVNLKILCAAAMAEGRLDRAERNALLEQVEERVAEMVLRDNHSHAVLLSRDFERSRHELPNFVRLIEDLEARAWLSSEQEGLPDGVELARRQQARQGLLRPELAKLAAFVKMEVYRALLEDPTFDGPLVQRALHDYWPAEVLERLGDAIDEHQLSREISATVITNRIVDEAGVTFFNEVTAATGRSPTQVAFAYLLAMDLLEAPRLFAEFDALVPKIRAGVHVRVRNEMHDALEEMVRWLLAENIDVRDPEGASSRLGVPFDAFRRALPGPLPLSDRREHARRIVWFRTRRIPEPLATQLASFSYQVRAGDVALLVESTRVSVRAGAELLNQIGSSTNIHTAFRLLRSADVSDRFQRSAMDLLRSELRHLRHDLTLTALEVSGNGNGERESVRKTVARFRSEHAESLHGIMDTAKYIQRAKATGIAPAVTLLHRIRALLRGVPASRT